MVDIDQLELLLLRAAREGRTLTYADVLGNFGQRIAPRRVFGLCRDLGEVCRRNRARNEPELAVLVVRKSDGLPGEGFFRSFWQQGLYDGPPSGPRARAFIRDEQERVFDYFAAGERPTSCQAQQRQDEGDHDDEADQIDDAVHDTSCSRGGAGHRA